MGDLGLSAMAASVKFAGVGDGAGWRLPVVALLLAATLAILPGPGVADPEEGPAPQVELWSDKTPTRSFTLFGQQFAGGLVLRISGEAAKIATGSAGLVSGDGVLTALAATVPDDGRLSPGNPVTVSLSASLSDGQVWKGEVWIDATDKSGKPLARTSIPIEVKRTSLPADALTLALDTEVRAGHCLWDAAGCAAAALQIRGSVTNTQGLPLPVPEIGLRSFVQNGTSVAVPAGTLTTGYNTPCNPGGGMIQPKQSCMFVLSLTNLPPAGAYVATFAAQFADAPLQQAATVVVKLRSSWWAMAGFVVAGALVAALVRWWQQVGRARVALMPNVARQRDLATGLAGRESDGQSREVAQQVAGLGTDLLATLRDPSATAAEPAVLLEGYTQKVDVLARWLAAMKLVGAMGQADRVALAPKVKAVSDRLRTPGLAPDPELTVAFEALLKAVDEARAAARTLADLRQKAIVQTAALKAAFDKLAPENKSQRERLENLVASLAIAAEGSNAAAIQDALAEAGSELDGSPEGAIANEAVSSSGMRNPENDDILSLLLSVGLPPVTASEAAFRQAGFSWRLAAAVASLVLTCLAATQVLWLGAPDWGTHENRLAAFVFGLAAGYGTQSVLQSLLPASGRDG